jgi:exopolysaccharide biosynthesis predicted pyruvyltransferase EpsI
VIWEATAPSRLDATASLVEGLRDALRDSLSDRLPPGTRVALLDFPNHDNLGDTAIWSGERALLRELGSEVAYTASFSSYSARMARRAIGARGVLLLHGGGNLGDLWPTYQSFRERVIASHPRTPIIQLPQTISFTEPAAVRRVAEAFSSHSDLTIMVRDRRSEELARDSFKNCRVVAAPDMAFALRELRAPEPSSPVLLLMRTDREREERVRPPLGDDVVELDWPTESRRGRLAPLYWLSRGLGYPAKRSPAAAYLVDRPLRQVFDSLAKVRTAKAPAIVGSGSVLVTDRLHGHILALLLGRPHVLLDDRHGKVRGFWERWTVDSPITRWAPDLESGLELARTMAGR